MGLQTMLVECPGYRVLMLVGELDVSSTPDLRQQICELLVSGELPLLLDMAGVSFCDTTGLGVAVSATKAAREAERVLAFAELSRRVSSVVGFAGLDQYFPIYPSLKAAVQSLVTDTTTT